MPRLDRRQGGAAVVAGGDAFKVFETDAGDATAADAEDTGEILGGEAINTSAAGKAVTIAAELSSAANKGVVIVAAGEGINVGYAAGTATVSAEDATDTNKGIASFNAADFGVAAGDVTIKAGGIAPAQLDATLSKRTILLTPNSANTPTANGAERAETQGTNHTYTTLAFDQTTLEKADWQFYMPANYDGGNVDVKILWSATAEAGGVVFDVNFQHVGDSDPIDPALTNQACAAVTVDGTTTDLNISSCTLTTPFNAGEYAIVRIHREVGDGGDDMTGDARVLMVVLEYTV